jgi:ribosomal protein S18 acetylase RimI-like enzyme
LASLDDLEFREARAEDAARIAALHADSWRRHYRGAYSDAYLDGDVVADRLSVWTQRLEAFESEACTILAERSEDDALIGFAHTIFDQDPTWGALIDNLHVRHGQKRRGIGSDLMKLTAKSVVGRSEIGGLYLWVLEQNVTAQAFYEACGGMRVERGLVPPPGGVASRLNGSPSAFRYAWPDPAVLIGLR